MSIFPEIFKGLLSMFDILKLEVGLYNGWYLKLEIPYWFIFIILCPIVANVF